MTEVELLNMTVSEEEFLETWNTREKKVMLRGTVPKEIAKFVEEKALEEFGLDQAARGKMLTKLLMIAKDCLEKEESEEE